MNKLRDSVGQPILTRLDLLAARYTLESPGANHRNAVENFNPPGTLSGKLR